MWRRLLARVLYGNVLAVSREWREADRLEQEARRRHGPTRQYTAEKSRLIHQALIAAARR